MVTKNSPLVVMKAELLAPVQVEVGTGEVSLVPVPKMYCTALHNGSG